jgi:hypothetical protein
VAISGDNDDDVLGGDLASVAVEAEKTCARALAIDSADLFPRSTAAATVSTSLLL